MSARLGIDFGRPMRTVAAADPRLQVTGGRLVTVTASLAGAAGASFEARLTG
ncbi:hypothetical protein [Knoellia remsis]|uniref:hypothetical protein n=1 Tax=Knoellia remsis TaxID=407159 RepID=UPI0014744572|nr:hypothetical protein [Knoellia remsis]